LGNYTIKAGCGKYPYTEGRHLIAAIELWAYGDESGTEGNPRFCLLLGYIGAPAEWESFNAEWKAILAEYGISEFHSIVFFSEGRRKSTNDPYRNWPPEKRLKFLDALLGAIHKHDIQPIGWAVDVVAFRALNEEQRRYLTGAHLESTFHIRMVDDQGHGIASQSRKLKTSGAQSKPYMLAFLHFLADAFKISPNDSSMHFMFDASKQEGVAKETFSHWRGEYPDKKRFESITFADSKYYPQLQAADLLAYSWYRKITHATVSSEILRARQSLVLKKRYLQLADATYFESNLKKLQQELQAEGLPWLSRPEDGIEMRRSDL